MYADELILDVAIYKAGCARIRLKSGINSLAKTYNYLLSDTDNEAEEIRIQDQSFADKIRLLDSLDGKEKETVINVLDAMLTKNAQPFNRKK